MPTPIYEEQRHPHIPQNVNELQRLNITVSTFNKRVAVALTKFIGTMWSAYAFALLALIGLLGLLGFLPSFDFLLASWFSQQFLQLVLLSVIMVGQNVLSQHAELLAEEQFKTTNKTYHDIEEVMKHLKAQDEKIINIDENILTIVKRLEQMERGRRRLI